MTAVETVEDFGGPPLGAAERWKAEIRAFSKEREGWRKRVEAIEKRYRDEREETDDARRFALLWANVEVLLPTLYARDPKPEVSRRFKDRDPVGRVMALILERNLDVALERDGGAFGRTMKASVKDFLLTGQGFAWVRYSVTMGTEGDGEQDDPGEIPSAAATPDRAPVLDATRVYAVGTPGQSLQHPPNGEAGEGGHGPLPTPVTTDEWAPFDYVHWRDAGFTAGARTWDEVTAVWRRSFLTRDALVKRFPEVGDRVPLDAKRDGDENDETFAKATVYEVWDSTDRKARWVHLDMDELLDERPYPLKISGKFPCPAPLFGTLTNGSMTPVPDYVQYQDQARELDELTGRIGALTSALRLAGFVPGDMAADVQKALDLEGEAKVIPVASWAAFGGQRMSDLIVWLPIEAVVKVLASLQQLRAQVKQDAYEITGLSDILRGSSAPQETATAQSLKAQWGSVRVRTRQGDVQRFAADALGLIAEVMVGHFDAKRLAETANVGALPPQDQQVVPMALDALMGDRALMHYRVDVETDSTVEADQAGDKAAWTELLQGVSAFLAAMGPVLSQVAQGAPAAAPAFAGMLGELLTGAVRRFKAGPGIETAIEAAFEALGQAAAQAAAAPPGPPPPDQAEQARMAAEQGKQQLGAGKLQVDGMKVQAERERTQAEMAAMQDDSAHRSADRQLEAARLQHEMQQAQNRPLVGGWR